MRKFALYLAVVVAAVGVLVLAAYTLLGAPTDLSVISVRVVDGESPMVSRDIGNWGPKQLFVIVKFKTSTNLASFADDGWHAGLFVDAYQCGSGDKDKPPISKGHPILFDEIGSVGILHNPVQKKGSHTYHTFVSLAEVETPTIPKMRAYNLVRQPDDICFVVVPNTAILGMVRPSNELRIPKGVLVKAIIFKARDLKSSRVQSSASPVSARAVRPE